MLLELEIPSPPLLNNELIQQIKSVPESELGYTGDLNQLPTNPPYGFWISKNGNFIKVGPYGHSAAASKVINNLRNFNIILKIYPVEHDKIYRFMKELGNIRIIISDYIYYNTQNLSSGQNKTLNFMKNLYNIETEFR